MEVSQSPFEIQKLEDKILATINLIRMKPAEFIKQLEDRLINMSENAYVDERQEKVVETLEGRKPILELIDLLDKMVPVVPLEAHRNLQKSAREQFSFIVSGSQQPTHAGEGGLPLSRRIHKAMGKTGSHAESFVKGEGTAESIVLCLLIDDGLPTRPNREVLLSKELKSFGAAFGAMQDGQPFCVLHFFGLGKLPMTATFPVNALDQEPWLTE